MLKTNLRNEINLRYNIVRWKKYHKLLCYNIFEKNNYNMIFETLEDVRYNIKVREKYMKK